MRGWRFGGWRGQWMEQCLGRQVRSWAQMEEHPFRQGKRQVLLRACREGAGADEMSIVREQDTGGVSNWQVSVSSNLNGELGLRWMEIWGEEQRLGRQLPRDPKPLPTLVWTFPPIPQSPTYKSQAAVQCSWMWPAFILAVKCTKPLPLIHH